MHACVSDGDEVGRVIGEKVLDHYASRHMGTAACHSCSRKVMRAHGTQPAAACSPCCAPHSTDPVAAGSSVGRVSALLQHKAGIIRQRHQHVPVQLKQCLCHSIACSSTNGGQRPGISTPSAQAQAAACCHTTCGVPVMTRIFTRSTCTHLPALNPLLQSEALILHALCQAFGYSTKIPGRQGGQQAA